MVLGPVPQLHHCGVRWVSPPHVEIYQGQGGHPSWISWGRIGYMHLDYKTIESTYFHGEILLLSGKYPSKIVTDVPIAVCISFDAS